MIRMANPTDRHRIHMSFMRTHGWYCQFLEDDLQTSLPTTLNFATSEKVIELIERGGGFTDSESRNTVADAIGMGRGGVYLSLTDEQYRKLAPSHP
jgi:hypothetical protein